jgi:hypothetical protein
MQPLAVVEAVEKGLERNRTVIAPGPTTRGLIWTERHAPWAINPLIGRIIGT